MLGPTWWYSFLQKAKKWAVIIVPLSNNSEKDFRIKIKSTCETRALTLENKTNM